MMQPISIPARDGYPLAAFQFGEVSERIWIIHSANGVAQKYYRAFAQEMAQRGLAVLTYDYRGIGGSREPGTLKNFQATMLDWALKDADGVHDWVREAHPSAKVSVIGHSFGGQMLGLLENRFEIKKVLLVASQLGYWRHFALRNQPSMIFYWYFLFPVLISVLGYFPMKKLGAGEDLPRGVALQWSRWCRHPEYLFSDLSDEQRRAYKTFPAPVLAFEFTDDAYAGGSSVKRLLSYYPDEGVRLRTVTPNTFGRPIGHFGFFRPVFQDSLWEEAYQWLTT